MHACLIDEGNKAYAYFKSPELLEAYRKEAEDRQMEEDLLHEVFFDWKPFKLKVAGFTRPGDCVVEITMSDSDWVYLAKKADAQGISLNDLLVKLLTDYAFRDEK